MCYLHYFIVLLLSIHAAFFTQQRDVPKLISNCSLIVLNNVTYDRNNNLVYIISDNDIEHGDDGIISSISAKLDLPVILSDQLLPPTDMYHRIFPLIYLLYSSNFSNLITLLATRLNVTHSNWYPRAKFIVVLPDTGVDTPLSAIETIAKILFTVNVHNFVILLPARNSKLVNIYKWVPFEEASRCGSAVKVKRISECDGLKLLTSTCLFCTSVMLRGCVIRAGAFLWPPYVDTSPWNSAKFVDGYHVLTIEALTNRYGIKVKYVTIEKEARWGILQNNGSWSGGLGALQNNQADALLGGCLQTPLRFSSFDCSPTFSSMLIKFYLALPGKLPHWKNMINIFSLAFWITITAIYFITSIFICILSRVAGSLEKPFFTNYTNCFLTLWRIACSSCTKTLPDSKAGRAVFLPWLVYSFHVSLVYTSSLLGVITTPVTEEPMRTLKELSSSKLHLLVVPQFVQISTMMDEELKSVINNKYVEYKPNDTEEIDRMIAKKDVTIFDPEEHFEILAKEKLSHIYALDDVVRLNPGIYLRRGSIFLQYVNNVQHSVLENGMFSKWQRDLIGAYRYQRHGRINYENQVLPLTLQELSGTFYVLIFGLILALISFSIEVANLFIFNTPGKRTKNN